jgi:hypothetical protein
LNELYPFIKTAFYVSYFSRERNYFEGFFPQVIWAFVANSKLVFKNPQNLGQFENFGVIRFFRGW